MDYETSQKLQSELSSGESLLWHGRPRLGIVLRGSDVFLIPFCLLWGGFAIFWEYSAYNSGAPRFFLIFGGVFVLIGLFLIFGRFIADSIKRNYTYYGVTNDRILILSEFPGRQIKSLSLRTLSDISFSDKTDGTGSITFGPQNPMAAWMGGGMAWPGMGQFQGPSFELISNVKGVYETIRGAQKKAV